MKVTKIPYEQTGYFTDIIIDYLNGKDSLRPFYKHLPHIESFGDAIEEKKKEAIDRNLLVEIITSQYANQEVSYVVQSNIESLRNKNSFCVVTAHQLNIFTGPLYVIYKTISAIQLCRQLKDNYPQYHFVPVFWLGSEDHDFEEINHFNLFGKTFTWNDKQDGACGRYHPQTLAPLLKELKDVLGESENAKHLYELFSKAYLEQPTLALSARYYLNKLFGEEGLVIVDGDHVDLKRICSSIAEDELMRQSSFAIVNKTIAELPFDAQAQPREINLFYLKDEMRERIVIEQGEFAVLNTSIKVPFDEMLTELDEHPERFSPNVILRPLFQQKVLPAIAFIGGGGEIAYWLQLKSLFEHFHIAFPTLVLRNSFLWVDAAAVKKINKLHLTEQELFEDEESLIKKFVHSETGGALSLMNEREEISAVISKILNKAVEIDSSLDKAVLAEQQSILHSLERLEAKFIKAEKVKAELEIQQIRALKQKLFPAGGLQERYDNFITYYLKYGKSFFTTLKEASDPLDKNLTIISEE